MAQKPSFRNRPDQVVDLIQEIEDIVATQEDIDNRDPVLKSFKPKAPDANEMKDGERMLIDDGTNIRYYRKIDGRLFYMDFTEVT